MGLSIIRATYDESFFVHKALEGYISTQVEIHFLVTENMLVGEKGFIYIGRAKVFGEKTLGLKSSQIHGVIYFAKALYKGQPSFIELRLPSLL